MMKKTAFFLLTLLAIAACAPKAPDIRIESAEAKLSPLLLGVAAVFLTIVNAGGADDLESARVEVADTITELHDIRDGKMVKISAIPIPAKGTVILRPASRHIMIFNLPKDAGEGYRLSLVLTFTKSGEKRVPLQLVPFSSRRVLQK